MMRDKNVRGGTVVTSTTVVLSCGGGASAASGLLDAADTVRASVFSIVFTFRGGFLRWFAWLALCLIIRWATPQVNSWAA
jgi:hypothetical protein